MEPELSFIDDDELMSALRLVKKLMPILTRKGKNAIITYVALKILLFDLEDDYGSLMTKEDEVRLKATIKALDEGS